MILIDQHGQWPLIIHNSYVVLIMIKLELLELGRLEYYLLGFDQGGKFAAEVESITFPIRFTKVFAVIPMMLDEPTPYHEMTIRPKAITTINFKMVSGSNNTNYPKSRNNGNWIAIGI